MKMTPEEYGRMAKKASPGSPFPKNCLLAFLIGGLICTLGQVCIELYQYAGLEQEVASTAASVTLVFLAVLLSGFGVYDNIAKYAGAGTLVPITGFANSVASPALEFKSEGLVLGLGAKMFIIAGPVIVYGTAASVVYGLIIYLFRFY